MRKLKDRLLDSLHNIYTLEDTTPWDFEPKDHKPIIGIYHVYCDKGWQPIVKRQMATLKGSGLMDATSRFCVSVISFSDDDIDELKAIIDTPKLEIIALNSDPTVYEYPAMKFMQSIAADNDCLIYYFHTKGISYQTVNTNDRSFKSFVQKVVAWCEMLEYFVFEKWRVAVNTLSNGYDAYGCYRWPPREFTMFSGNFYWITSQYVRTLPPFNDERIANDRFYCEVWPFECNPKIYSPFESSADLYFVRIPRSLYTMQHPPLADHLKFVTVCNYRKMLKHVFRYNYKYAMQGKYQKLVRKK